MNFGISTSCFYPAYLELAVEDLARHGVQNIEIFVNTYSEMRPAYLHTLKQELDANNMHVVSVHPFTSGQESFLFFSDYYRRFLDGIEQYKAYCDFMNALGARILVFHGNRKESAFPDEQYYERFGILRDALKREGAVLAQENVAPYKSRSLDFLKGMQSYLHGDVDFVLDIKQTVRADQDVFAMIDALGENIVHLHVSDNKEGFDCLPIGVGTFDFVRFFDKMREKNFQGSAMLELYRSNYNEYEELYQSLEKLKQYQW